MRTKSGSMPLQVLQIDLCKLICMKEYYVQGKLAICMKEYYDWKLQLKVQNENEATFLGSWTCQ
jgi:hypothetical protein